MKSLLTISILAVLTSPILLAKNYAGSNFDTQYGVAVKQLHNGTGHGMGYTLNTEVNKGRKALEVGFIYSMKEQKVAGGDLRYKVYLGSLHRATTNKRTYRPYVQYNLQYQKGMSSGNEVVSLENIDYEMEGDPGMVATIGHYLAYGNKINIFDNAFIDSSIGLGVYQGSLDKIHGPGTVGYHKDNFGVTYAIKIGIGFILN